MIIVAVDVAPELISYGRNISEDKLYFKVEDLNT